MKLRNKISKLIEVIKDTDINEIEISSFWGAQKIKLRKSINSNENIAASESNQTNFTETTIVENSNSNLDNKKNDDPIEDLSNDLHDVITAPLVGTFYEAPKPGEPPYIVPGDTIEDGQPLCIIEAMKIFNKIESDFSGEIVEVLVSDGEPVEFGQPLFKFIKK